MRVDSPNATRQAGFTLLELMIVVAILAVLAVIGVPQYTAALQAARVGKAKHELRTISNAIDTFTANNMGTLPLTLYQVGFGGKKDPWGTPYCYLNYSDGTGDGLDWAIAAGVVDPSAFAPVTGGAGGGDGGLAVDLPQGRSSLAAPQRRPLPAAPQGRPFSAAPQGRPGRPNVQVNFTALSELLGRSLNLTERGALTEAARSHGGFSIFTGVETARARRRDRYMFPLNTDYDLFSLGPDHQTATSLGEGIGLDDVIRANNGGFFGRASDY